MPEGRPALPGLVRRVIRLLGMHNELEVLEEAAVEAVWTSGATPSGLVMGEGRPWRP
jgi:hypothetical protein